MFQLKRVTSTSKLGRLTYFFFRAKSMSRMMNRHWLESPICLMSEIQWHLLSPTDLPHALHMMYCDLTATSEDRMEETQSKNPLTLTPRLLPVWLALFHALTLNWWVWCALVERRWSILVRHGREKHCKGFLCLAHEQCPDSSTCAPADRALYIPWWIDISRSKQSERYHEGLCITSPFDWLLVHWLNAVIWTKSLLQVKAFVCMT